jgi:hypothetical protein
MSESDFDAFAAILDGVCGLLSRGAYAPNAVNTAMFFRSLAAHDLATVRAAFDAHVGDAQRGRFVPVPADIVAQIEAAAPRDNRPGADEAWAIAIRAKDEAATVVWTAEIAQAFGVARPVLDAGDKVGARMAFLEAYRGAVAEARRNGERAAWSTSLGSDPHQRDAAVRSAVALGYLPSSDIPALPAPVQAPTEQLKGWSDMPAEVIKALDRLRIRLVPEPAINTQERDATAARKALLQRHVDRYVAGKRNGAELQERSA